MEDIFVCVPRDLQEKTAISRKDPVLLMVLPARMEEHVLMTMVLHPMLPVCVLLVLLATSVKLIETTVNPTHVRMEEHVQMLVWVSAVLVPMAIQESSAAAVSHSVQVAHVRMEGLAMNIPREGSSASVNQNLLA